jgi:hypothetical protein
MTLGIMVGTGRGCRVYNVILRAISLEAAIYLLGNLLLMKWVPLKDVEFPPGVSMANFSFWCINTFLEDVRAFRIENSWINHTY